MNREKIESVKMISCDYDFEWGNHCSLLLKGNNTKLYTNLNRLRIDDPCIREITQEMIDSSLSTIILPLRDESFTCELVKNIKGLGSELYCYIQGLKQKKYKGEKPIKIRERFEK